MRKLNKCTDDDIDKMIATSKRKKRHIVIGGDFNAVVGHRQVGKASNVVGSFGLGKRNDRGDMMTKWALCANLAITNTQFQKPHDRTWTFRKKGK